MKCQICGYQFKGEETPNWQNEKLPDVPLCGECDYQLTEGSRKVIIKGPTDDGEPLYWSNRDGWVNQKSAIVFDINEVIDCPPLVEQSALEFVSRKA